MALPGYYTEAAIFVDVVRQWNKRRRGMGKVTTRKKRVVKKKAKPKKKKGKKKSRKKREGRGKKKGECIVFDWLC
jgi:hypothetical protein